LWHVVLSGPATPSGGVLYVNDGAGVLALRLADGRILWCQQAFGSMQSNLVADSGYLFGTMSGEDDPCHMPFVHQSPMIRALRSADGSIAWTQALDATP
jgi:hypothetical protein